MKIDRLLSIIIYLLNRELVSAAELARRFEVSVRTIQRDMDSINLAGIPVVSVQGREGGYGILDTYKMDRRFLTADDLFYIITALSGIDSSLSDRRIGDALEKMRGLVSPTGNEFQERQEKLRIDFSMLGGGPSQREVFRVVQQAVESDRLLRMGYTNNRLENSLRIVEPMTVVFTWRSWYLFAYCRLRRDYRLFRISRIRGPEILEGSFRRREMTYDRFKEERNPETAGASVELVLRFASEVAPLVEEFYREEDLERGTDGSVTVRTRLPEDGWMYGYILSYGEFVEVLEPARLRRVIRSSAAKIEKIYD